LEYVITGNNAVFPIRLGFRTDPKASLLKWSGSFSNPDTTQAVGMVFTGGFGLIMGKVNLDLAYEYGQTILRDQSETVLGEEAVEKANEKQHTVLASCIFHF
ncbi:MAG TPA: hypothetical protein VMF29_01770, partial [Candidatus Edwardsbacteria bacterium]|nr:hypothetical protein [Candidatus Edwardsbacteria bacterium]